MRHDDECAFNESDCGCARRRAQRARESYDMRTAYRFLMLGASTEAGIYPFPRVARPIRIVLGERYGMTEEGGFVLPLTRGE